MTPTQTLGDIPESTLIQVVSRVFGPPPAGVTGVGDDAAVVPQTTGRLVVTTDTLVEGTHFRKHWLSARALGARAMAVAASDLPAMGAVPQGAVVALNLPKSLPLSFFRDLLGGLAGARKKWRLPVLGGNLARSKELSITPTVWGRVRKRPLLRRGARAGHWVFVTGVPGWAHLGLNLLIRYAPLRGTPSGRQLEALSRPGARTALRAWLRPEPRWDVMNALRRRQPTAVLDTSDSLVQTLKHMMGDRLDVSLAEPRVPKSYIQLARSLGIGREQAWFHGGEDYQLCFSVRPAQGKRLLRSLRLDSRLVTFVGCLETGSGKLWTASGQVPLEKDFRHFG